MVNPMLPYQNWRPSDDEFDTPEWIVADAILGYEMGEVYEMAPIDKTLKSHDVAMLAIMALRYNAGSENFAIIDGRLVSLPDSVKPVRKSVTRRNILGEF